MDILLDLAAECLVQASSLRSSSSCPWFWLSRPSRVVSAPPRLQGPSAVRPQVASGEEQNGPRGYFCFGSTGSHHCWPCFSDDLCLLSLWGYSRPPPHLQGLSARKIGTSGISDRWDLVQGMVAKCGRGRGAQGEDMLPEGQKLRKLLPSWPGETEQEQESPPEPQAGTPHPAAPPWEP